MSDRPNFKPDYTIPGKNKTFKYWVQSVLPIVYDDSLSYMELLNKVVVYLNEMGTDVNTLIDEFTELDNAFSGLQNYLYSEYNNLESFVNNYFNNLDVQEEINNKLDVMAEDGTLDELIQPYIAEYANDLRVLEARMDTFASLPDGSTAGDAELLDIRVGADGVIYPSAGDAVRSQVSKINDNLTFIVPNILEYNKLNYAIFTDGYYIQPSNGTTDVNAAYSYCDYIEVREQTNYIISKHGNVYGAFYNSNKEWLTGIIAQGSAEYIHVTAPAAAKYIRLSCQTEYTDDLNMSIEDISYLSDDIKVHEKNIVKQDNTLTVSLDGTKDFTSIKDAIDSITDASENNTYTIQIYAGTYDIKSYYTAEQWAVESTAFIGLSVPDHVTLEGVGDRDAVILTASDTTPRNYISTLNLSSVCGLKNLTVKSDGLRYAVHDDFSSNNTKGYRKIENCVFEQVNGFYVQAYGAGFHDQDTVIMKSCICKTDAANGFSISFHNSTDIVFGSYLEFENCRFQQQGLNLITIADGAKTNVLLKGVKADSLVLNRQTSNTGIMYKVSGYANEITTITTSLTPASDYVDLI